MPPESDGTDRDAALLLDMLTAARAVISFVNGRTWEQYAADLLLRSAVERQIEIIGFKTAHPAIAWRPIMAQRHRLAHENGNINDELIQYVLRF